jgi:hypothetical protein
VIRPFAVLPDEPKELAPLAAIVLDDPAGITPEARLALGGWLERGGVALALLGPRADAEKLGSTLEPFVRGEAQWSPAKTESRGVDPKSATWLGEAGASLAALGAIGSVELDTNAPTGARTLLRWDDGRAFLIEAPIGRGAVLVCALPASVDASDFALRPGFLALLDHTLAEAARRSGPPRSRAGVTWLFASGSQVAIQGPEGPLAVEEQRAPSDGAASTQKVAVPEVRGRYRVKTDTGETLRVVTVDAEELTRRAKAADAAGAVVAEGAAESRVDASREIALLLLVLLAVELGLRAHGRLRRRRRPSERAGDTTDDLRRAA